MNDFLNGVIVGVTHTLSGHPLDTLKVLKQLSNKPLPYSTFNFSRLYKGVSFPLFGSGIYNSIQFGVHQQCYKKGYSHFTSGAVAGLLSGFVISPIDIYKVNRQVLRNKSIPLFRGLHVTLARETTSTAFYFGSYFYLMEKWGNKYSLGAFISGGFAGMAAWLCNYPVDVVKSRIMSYQANTIMDAIRMGNLWGGLEFCLLRGFVVNGCGFMVFNILQKNIQK